MRSEYTELDTPKRTTSWTRRAAMFAGALLVVACASFMVAAYKSNMKISMTAPSHLVAVEARPATLAKQLTAEGGDHLLGQNNEYLLSNVYLESSNDAYFAVMQGDGNFVVYVSPHLVPANALWASGTHGKGKGPFKLVMQSDNNLVIYDSTGRPTWASGTHNRGSRPAKVFMQSDGNLVIYDGANRPIWATNTFRKLKALLQRFGLHMYHEDDPKEVAKRLKAMEEADKQQTQEDVGDDDMEEIQE